MLDNDQAEEAIEHQGRALSDDEQEDVEAHGKLRPLAVYEVVRREGVEELARPTGSLWWSGLAAGLSIAFSVVAEGALHAGLPDAGWRPLVENLGYSVGFLIVILARQQLFTEITLTAVLPVLAAPSWPKLRALGRLWSVVFAANMVGTALFAWASVSGLFFSEELQAGMLSIARELAELTFGQAFWRGIVAGWMIATLVWVLPSAEVARLGVIVVITYLIALFELAHVVAGSMEVFMLVFHGELGLGQGVLGLILPMLVGNVVGGSALFALLAHGQVRDEMEPD